MVRNNTEYVKIPLETEVKQQADELFAEMGLSLSRACWIFVQQALIEGGMPFDFLLERKPAHEV